MTAMFVTATGTDVGKTFVACGMIKHLRARGLAVDALKPIVTGFDAHSVHTSDTGRLLAALGQALTPQQIAQVSPFRLRAPLSPDMAARIDGASIDFKALNAFCRSAIGCHKDALIIEGIGGIMVPLDERHTVLDWMIELDLPAILVAGSYVGTLSHTLSALDVLERHELKVAAVVVSETPESSVRLDETVDSIADFAAAPVIALPRLPPGRLDHPAFQQIAATL